MRAADTSRRLFSPQGTYAGDGLEASFQNETGITPAEVPEIVAEYREIWRDLGLNSAQASEIVSLGRLGQPAPETSVQWRKETMEALRARHFGDEKAVADDLALAHKLAVRDPRVLHMMNQFGLGDHPRVIEMFIERAREERLAGRLK